MSPSPSLCHHKEQEPHAQDEIYVIVRGRGVLFHDGKRDPFESGDILFVAAGIEHLFENVTEDLALWRCSTALMVARSRLRASPQAKLSVFDSARGIVSF